MNQKIKVALAGVHRASAFLRAFQLHPQTEIVALCDLNPSALAETGKLIGVSQLYTHYEKMLDDVKPDVVVVATPMQFHAAQSIAALQRNIHVLCEVTAAVGLDEARWLVQACQQSSAIYMMAENCNYSRQNMLLNALVDAGLFGDVYYAEGEYLHNVQTLHHTPDGKPTWRYYWQVGVNGATYATHSLGPCLQWVKERITQISCIGTGRWSDPEHTIEDTVQLSCKTASGKLIRHRLDMLSKRPHPFTVYYALQGTKGAYESARRRDEDHWVWLEDRCPDPNQWVRLETFADEFLPEVWRNPPPEVHKIGHSGSEYFLVLDFIDAVQGKKSPAVGIHETMDMTLPGLVSQESIRRGGVWLDVPDSRDW
ncbi:MAG: Gfo/Idh/MocA family oxidoreductase [Chloroflexi bacterium]|nr:Gfo/Idh/MocA family oxidoreductase [Chloroflexota bacterium]